MQLLLLMRKSRKKLYFLIPFYLFNREKDFKECEDDDERLVGLLGEVSRLVSRLIIDAKTMLEDGLEPGRVARIFRVTVEEPAQLTGNAAGNAIMRGDWL